MALAMQNAMLDEDEFIHEPNISRAIAGRRNRELGDMFESWILRGCDWYWERGIAYIEKTPEPMRPIKAYGDRRRGQFIAVYTKQAQPDFKGTLCDSSTILMRKVPVQIPSDSQSLPMSRRRISTGTKRWVRGATS